MRIALLILLNLMFATLAGLYGVAAAKAWRSDRPAATAAAAGALFWGAVWGVGLLAWSDRLPERPRGVVSVVVGVLAVFRIWAVWRARRAARARRPRAPG